MATPRKLILELVEDLPEEKLGKVISFIKFVKEEEPILVLEPEDEEDILNILEEDEWYSSEEIEKIIKIDTRGDIYKD